MNKELIKSSEERLVDGQNFFEQEPFNGLKNIQEDYGISEPDFHHFIRRFAGFLRDEAPRFMNEQADEYVREVLKNKEMAVNAYKKATLDPNNYGSLRKRVRPFINKIKPNERPVFLMRVIDSLANESAWVFYVTQEMSVRHYKENGDHKGSLFGRKDALPETYTAWKKRKIYMMKKASFIGLESELPTSFVTPENLSSSSMNDWEKISAAQRQPDPGSLPRQTPKNK